MRVSVTHGCSAFGGADHGWQDVGLEKGAWTLSQAVSGSVRSQGAATNVSTLRVGTDWSWRSQKHSADSGAGRLGDYDQLHHFIGAGVWDARPVEIELLVQADRLVGGRDAVLGRKGRFRSELAQDTSSSVARLPASGAAGDGATARAPWPSPAPAVEIRLIAAAKSRFMGLHLFSCRGSVGVLNATSSNESPCCLAWNSEGCSQGGGSIHADLAAALTAVSRADYVVCGTLRVPGGE